MSHTFSGGRSEIVAVAAWEGESGNLSDGQRDALAFALERTVQTCELLETYAVGVAGKQPNQ